MPERGETKSGAKIYQMGEWFPLFHEEYPAWGGESEGFSELGAARAIALMNGDYLFELDSNIDLDVKPNPINLNSLALFDKNRGYGRITDEDYDLRKRKQKILVGAERFRQRVYPESPRDLVFGAHVDMITATQTGLTYNLTEFEGRFNIDFMELIRGVRLIVRSPANEEFEVAPEIESDGSEINFGKGLPHDVAPLAWVAVPSVGIAPSRFNLVVPDNLTLIRQLRGRLVYSTQ